MPRWAVSMASATPNPYRQSSSRNRRVASQSMRPPGQAATCAAAYTLRRTGGGYPAAQAGVGTSSGAARPGSTICAFISDLKGRHGEAAPLRRGLLSETGELHALRTFGEIPRERGALGRGPQEQLPLDLEAVAQRLVVWNVGPLCEVIDRIRQVR